MAAPTASREARGGGPVPSWILHRYNYVLLCIAACRDFPVNHVQVRDTHKTHKRNRGLRKKRTDVSRERGKPDAFILSVV